LQNYITSFPPAIVLEIIEELREKALKDNTMDVEKKAFLLEFLEDKKNQMSIL